MITAFFVGVLGLLYSLLVDGDPAAFSFLVGSMACAVVIYNGVDVAAQPRLNPCEVALLNGGVVIAAFFIGRLFSFGWLRRSGSDD